MNCRYCHQPLHHVFINLQNCPPSNSYLSLPQLDESETYYPLKVFVCEKCFLVQVNEYKRATEIFDENYAYFSSYSSTWLQHCSDYADMISSKLNLGKESLAIEIASNDGYLLQYFSQKGIPVLGIEPTQSTANIALQKGISTRVDFFGVHLANQLNQEQKIADLIIGNNVLAHVPDINDFVSGLKIILKPVGVITMEFPHLLSLIRNNQFDTIYHEHFSYLSLLTVLQIFEYHGLEIFDVDELSTHGGSLRIYAQHKDNKLNEFSKNIDAILEKEKEFGLLSISGYSQFKQKANQTKYDFLAFLLEQKKAGKKIAAYGAAAKGNTLLNYCGVKADLIDYVVDASPYKQGKYMPGSHLPIVKEEIIRQTKPDFIIILPWNIKEEVILQLNYTKEWNAKFVVAIPNIEILNP